MATLCHTVLHIRVSDANSYNELALQRPTMPAEVFLTIYSAIFSVAIYFSTHFLPPSVSVAAVCVIVDAANTFVIVIVFQRTFLQRTCIRTCMYVCRLGFRAASIFYTLFGGLRRLKK